MDECVLLHALRGVDAHDLLDDSSVTFLGLLFYNCHSIVFTNEIRGAFYRAVNEGASLGRRGDLLYPGVLHILKQILGTPTKSVWVNPDAVVLRDTFPDEDEYLVKAALLASVHLVTDDGELISAVGASPQCKQVGVAAMMPREAIESVSAPE